MKRKKLTLVDKLALTIVGVASILTFTGTIGVIGYIVYYAMTPTLFTSYVIVGVALWAFIHEMSRPHE